jgi:hypothetical protein
MSLIYNLSLITIHVQCSCETPHAASQACLAGHGQESRATTTCLERNINGFPIIYRWYIGSATVEILGMI